jgi:hypothetical protein
MVNLYTVLYQGDVKGAIKVSERIFFNPKSADDWGKSTIHSAQTYTVMELVPVHIEQEEIKVPITQPQQPWYNVLGWFNAKL